MTPEQIQNLEAALSFLRVLFDPPAEEEEPTDDLDYEDDEVDDVEAQIATLSAERDAAVEALERAHRIIREQNTRLQGAYEAAGNLHNALHGVTA